MFCDNGLKWIVLILAAAAVFCRGGCGSDCGGSDCGGTVNSGTGCGTGCGCSGRLL